MNAVRPTPTPSSQRAPVARGGIAGGRRIPCPPAQILDGQQGAESLGFDLRSAAMVHGGPIFRAVPPSRLPGCESFGAAKSGR